LPEFKPLFPVRDNPGFTPTHLTPRFAATQKAEAQQTNEATFEAVHADGALAPAADISPEDKVPISDDSSALGPEDAPASVDERIAHARAQGIKEGRRQAEAEFDKLNIDLETLNQGLDQLHDLRRQSVQAAAKDVGALVSSLTRRLFYDNLVLHPKALATLVEEALRAMPEDQKVWITAHPDHIERLGDLMTTGRAIEVLEDRNIEAGFRIHNKHASIDSTLSKLLEGIDAAIQHWQNTQ
jgi:flagellar biosynthesis/type III secretory pathway protein FliH